MTKKVKEEGKPEKKLSSEQVVKLALREMKNAVPEIEKRVMKRDAIAAESRFEAPRSAEIVRWKDDD